MAQFSGKSERGDFQEALQVAMATALQQLQTDFIHYKVLTIEGTQGGFVLENIMTVTIEAEGPKK